MIRGTSLFEPQHPETKKDDTLLNGKGFLLITLFVQGVVMILANTIFMTARIALDRVADAFAFLCQPSSLAEALQKSLSTRVAVETSSFSHTECDVFRNVSCRQLFRNFWFIRLNWFLENRVFRVPAFVPKV